MCSSYVISPFPSVLVSKAQDLQVAHGLILRCFVKRWLGFSVDFPIPMMLDPGAIAVLRFVGIGSHIIF